MKFTGTMNDLARIVQEGEVRGRWSAQGEKVVFQSEGGAVMSWWPDSENKTLQIQGAADDCARLAALLSQRSGSGWGRPDQTQDFERASDLRARVPRAPRQGC